MAPQKANGVLPSSSDGRVRSNALPHELLKMYRQRAGLTQEQFARLIGLKSSRIIRSWEAGESLPRPERLRTIVQKLVEKKIFAGGLEEQEANQLWDRIKGVFDAQPFRLVTYPIFDRVWFNTLVNASQSVSSTPALSSVTSSKQQIQQEDENAGQKKKEKAQDLGSELTVGVNSVGEDDVKRDFSVTISTNPTTTSSNSNIEQPPCRLLGRERDLDCLVKILQNSKNSSRVITISGPAGVGKTRLALETAITVIELNLFEGGVYFFELATARELDQVLSVLTEFFRIPQVLGRSHLENLATYLVNKKMLLVLDNLEQLHEADVLLHDLVTKAQGVKFLLTSREPLHLYGEQRYILAPLEIPPIEDMPVPIEEQLYSFIANYSSVALFVERVQQSDPHFQLNDTNALIIARICQKLDGLPLALELAAARTNLLTLEELLERLENPLDLLGNTKPNKVSDTSNTHQQTLRRTLEWSYNLLSIDEQLLFRLFGVFADSCTLSVLEGVLKSAQKYSDLWSPNSFALLREMTGIKLLDLVSSLVDKSLLQRKTVHISRTKPLKQLMNLLEKLETELETSQQPQFEYQQKEEEAEIGKAKSESKQNIYSFYTSNGKVSNNSLKSRVSRLQMLETIREYAQELLQATAISGNLTENKNQNENRARTKTANEWLTIHLLVAQYYTDVLQEVINKELSGTQLSDWLLTVEREYNNIQYINKWLLDHLSLSLSMPDLASLNSLGNTKSANFSFDIKKIGLKIALSLQHYWLRRGLFYEGQQWLQSWLSAIAPNVENVNIDQVTTVSTSSSNAPAINSEKEIFLSYAYGLINLYELNTEAGDYNNLNKKNIDIALNIFDRLSNTYGQARAMLAFSDHYKYKKELSQAEDSLHQSLHLATLNSLKFTSIQIAAQHKLATLMQVQGNHQMVEHYCTQALQLLKNNNDDFYLVNVLNLLAGVAYHKGDYDQARFITIHCLNTASRLGDRKSCTQNCINLGASYHNQQNYALAASCYEIALKLAQELDNKQLLAAALRGLGNLAIERGNYYEATNFYDQARSIYEQTSNNRNLAWLLFNQATLALEQLEFEKADMLLAQSLALHQELNSRTGIAYSLCTKGFLALSQGLLEPAQEFLTQSLTLAEEISYNEVIAYSSLRLGLIHIEQTNYKDALTLLKHSLDIGKKTGEKKITAVSTCYLAYLLQQEKHYPEAYSLYLRSLEIYRSLSNRRGLVDLLISLTTLLVTTAHIREASWLLYISEQLIKEFDVRLDWLSEKLYRQSWEQLSPFLEKQSYQDIITLENLPDIKQILRVLPPYIHDIPADSRLAKRQIKVVRKHLPLTSSTPVDEAEFIGNIPSSPSQLASESAADAPNFPNCSFCKQSIKVNKAGHNPNGTQRYRCRACQKYFTPTAKTQRQQSKAEVKKYPPELKLQAINLYKEGRGLRSIARELGVTHQTISLWVANK